ncbi:hypothetical protein MTR01_27830 [Burkholderia thailandensis]|uniref:hypothetical protein n=1 Tax=Burkholderia thailandensis TaxID=57975 RepID=UPI0022AC6CF4|nr:hypothetical protein [Burkholderia thailandensis]MCZ2897835.1 hypothetical protein [Burkholderia thailandensis]
MAEEQDKEPENNGSGESSAPPAAASNDSQACLGASSPRDTSEGSRANIGSQESDDIEDELDATTDAPGALAPPTVLPPAHDDVSRRVIAYWLLGLLTLLEVGAVAGYASLFFGDKKPTFEEFKTLLELILTPLITLVSAATGFYFGSANKKSS